MRKLIIYAAIFVVGAAALLWLSSIYINQRDEKTITATSSTQATTTATPQTTQVDQKAPAKEMEVSFIASAKGAMLQKLDGQRFSLSMYDVKPYISMISERPHREQKPVPLQQFIKLWSYGTDSLAVNPPNAYLMPIYINGQLNKTGKIYVFTLTAPRYDTKRNTLTFTAKLLQAPAYLLKQVKFDYAFLTIER